MQIWAGPLSNNRIVVALVNLGTAATNITVTWDVLGLGLELGLIATARDVWEVGPSPPLKFNIDKLIATLYGRVGRELMNRIGRALHFLIHKDHGFLKF